MQVVAKELHLDWHAVKDLEQQYMRAQLARVGLPGPKAVGIDEISIRKGHDYRIVVSDLIRKRPIWFGGDAVIPEPYVDHLPQSHVWRGSSNQPLVPLSERGRARYAEHVAATSDATSKRMQAAIEGGRVWMIGIPGRGDLAQVEALCASRGLALSKVSWRR